MRDVKDLIMRISEGESRAHAYIVEGSSESSRAEFTGRLIAGLECECDEPAARPCGRCPSCKQAKAGTHPDVVYMQASGKNGYKVEDATAFIERLGMSAYGRHLIGVVLSAESMSDAVQNKLLKTLEEPCEDVIIILSTGRAAALLPTVRSRCSTLRTKKFEAYEQAEDDASSDLAEGAFMMLTQRSAFYEFRDYIGRHIKSRSDAHALIGVAEDKLRGAMTHGKAMTYCAERIELAEKIAADIERGMDASKALKKLFLSYCENRPNKA